MYVCLKKIFVCARKYNGNGWQIIYGAVIGCQSRPVIGCQSRPVIG